jgi:putative CocE/NonD family hydrolase
MRKGVRPRRRTGRWLLKLCAACSAAAATVLCLPTFATSVDSLPSDIVADFKPSIEGSDYLLRQVMIPMRDGVRLRALIAMKKGVARAPMLLERTPYGADSIAFRTGGEHLAARVSLMNGPFVEDGYILVWEDIRGRSKSEGTFLLNRPLRGPLNSTGIDEDTDAYDTIEWLAKNVPESNKRVGIIGGSYDGANALSAALNAHPALKAVVAINPMVDVWKGDDWYHNGAFRQITLSVLPILLTGKELGSAVPPRWLDLYSAYLESGSAGDVMRRYGLDRFAPARKFMEHPSYDAWWRGQALDSLLATKTGASIPTLLVAGMWDEQDQYGAPAVFEALRAKDASYPVSLLIGPWTHMGVYADGSKTGPLHFIEDTAAVARRDVIKPFLDSQLKEGTPTKHLAPIVSFSTGSERWHDADALAAPSEALYLREHTALSFEEPTTGAEGADEYISDPAHPVGMISSPFTFAHAWATSLVADQRFAAQRPDVLSYRTSPLTSAVHIFGRPQVDLFAATTGTDSDWVVKLIDVYPDETSDQDMSGFQLAVSADIFRGRYIHGLDQVYCWTPGRPEEVQYPLPLVDHTFLPGHRIMVQIQSTWFPVYDRNPQTCVPNIFNAQASDYASAKQTVFRERSRASKVLLPILLN